MCSQPLYLAQLSTVVMSFLWKNERQSEHECHWNNEQQLNFFKFCRNFLLLSNITDYIVYTGLKYIEIYLSKVKMNRYCIPEYNLFTIGMILGHKYHEDVGIYNQPLWEMASGLVHTELAKLEWEFLLMIDYKLYLCPEEYLNWYSKCNQLYDYHKSFVDIFNQPNNNNDNMLCYLPSSSSSYTTASCFPMDDHLLEADTSLMLIPDMNLITVNDLHLSDTSTIDSGIHIHDNLCDTTTNMLDQLNLLNMTTSSPEYWEPQTAYNYNSLFIM